MKRMSVAEVQRDLESALAAAEQGESTAIERDGKPVAVLGPVEEQAERPDLPRPKRPGGALALVGWLSDWDTIEADMAEVIAMRQEEISRPPPEFD